MDLRLIAYVGFGGALGSLARYALGTALGRGSYPWGILTVNVLGCFLIGLLVYGGVQGGWLTPAWQAFLAIGVLGGFTTMSSFTFGAVELLEEGAFVKGAGYVIVTVSTCLLATWLGRAVALVTWPK